MKTVKPGIRLKPNGKYYATKSFRGKRYYAEFDKERDAIKWRKEFHPFAIKKTSLSASPTSQLNGADKEIIFGEVITLYRDNYLKAMSPTTQHKKMLRLERFAKELTLAPMCMLNPEVITNHIETKKLQIERDSKRCNFDKELKDIASIFNWYKGNKDFTFVNPVTRIHYKIGKIKDIAPKNKYLSLDEILAFLDYLPPMYRSMAKIMYIWALRVGEVAAISDDSINFKRKELYLYNVMTWLKGSPTLKRGDKTGTDAILPITDVLEDELLKLKESKPKTCKYYFHHKGKPLRYAMILKVFNQALLDAGLPYSGTHILRHSMATETRRSLGLDASQAILRHSSSRMSEEYAKLDVSEKVSNVVIEASNLFRKSKKNASTCVRDAISD